MYEPNCTKLDWPKKAQEEGRQAALNGEPPMLPPKMTSPDYWKYLSASLYHSHWMVGYRSVNLVKQ
jgi:hypothetical protein